MRVNILYIATVFEVERFRMLIRHSGIVGEKTPNNVQIEMVSETHFTQLLNI